MADKKEKNQTQKAYEYLLFQIIHNVFLPNDSIVEQDISEKLGISRTPVRAALVQLESQDMVIHIPSKGTIVKSITLQDVQEIFRLRTMFEMEALQDAIQTMSDEDLDHFTKLFEEVKNSEDVEKYYWSDRELHRTIVKQSFNTRMINIYDMLDLQCERLRRLPTITKERLKQSAEEHSEIIEAIRSRDLEYTKGVLLHHLHNIEHAATIACMQMNKSLIDYK